MGIICLAAWQTFGMKYQNLFSTKNKKKIRECRYKFFLALLELIIKVLVDK